MSNYVQKLVVYNDAEYTVAIELLMNRGCHVFMFLR